MPNRPVLLGILTTLCNLPFSILLKHRVGTALVRSECISFLAIAGSLALIFFNTMAKSKTYIKIVQLWSRL